MFLGGKMIYPLSKTEGSVRQDLERAKHFEDQRLRETHVELREEVRVLGRLDGWEMVSSLVLLLLLFFFNVFFFFGILY